MPLRGFGQGGLVSNLIVCAECWQRLDPPAFQQAADGEAAEVAGARCKL